MKPKRAQYSGRGEEGEIEGALSHKERRDNDGRERKRDKERGSAKRTKRDQEHGRSKKGKERIKRDREYDDGGKESCSMKKRSKVSSHKNNDDEIWVSSNLRVRVIDKEFYGGKYYNKKVIIIMYSVCTLCRYTLCTCTLYAVK